MGLAWIPFLRSPRAVSPVPHIAFSVTPTAITILRVMQWMAVVLCCVSLAVALTWWNDSVVMEETATHLDGVVRRLNQANTNRAERMTRERLTLSADQIAAITRDVRFVNQLAEKRAFSWSRLLADLESTLPPHMALRTVQLNFQDSTVALHGSAASLQDIRTFMTNLEHHTAFRHAALASHRLEHQERQPSQASMAVPDTMQSARGVDFQLTVGYRPSW
ncbi:MAG: PilN domain-containing protein [Nitrospira sp.]|nr:PilN domain-containing protein [Nitrospira sp.]MCW5796038.1 PilN domain-containing protein [Nitrospira sp.]HMW88347.1 PilN domain-containing protein [Nitrospira sp.]HMZ99141.1 PilN domain-containing protein [Nitrospira sp.]HNG04765.1 PilN domain-containing protein [Nitrospira sp.]